MRWPRQCRAEKGAVGARCRGAGSRERSEARRWRRGAKVATGARRPGRRRHQPSQVRAGGRRGQPSGARRVPTRASGREERDARCWEPATPAGLLARGGRGRGRCVGAVVARGEPWGLGGGHPSLASPRGCEFRGVGLDSSSFRGCDPGQSCPLWVPLFLKRFLCVRFRGARGVLLVGAARKRATPAFGGAEGDRPLLEVLSRAPPEGRPGRGMRVRWPPSAEPRVRPVSPQGPEV